MNKIYFFALVLSLTVCQTVGNYNAQLNTLVGQTEDYLIDEWGEPGKVQTINPNEQIFTYTKQNEVIIPAQYSYYYPDFNGMETLYAPFTYQQDFAPNPFETTDGYEVKDICQTSFHIKNGIVESWQWKGNNF